MPRRGVTYRCHICRLELIIDLEAVRMTLAPLADETGDEPDARRAVRDVGPAVADDRGWGRTPARSGTLTHRSGRVHAKARTHFQQVPVAVLKRLPSLRSDAGAPGRAVALPRDGARAAVHRGVARRKEREARRGRAPGAR
jgi:hypothetical protein